MLTMKQLEELLDRCIIKLTYSDLFVQNQVCYATRNTSFFDKTYGGSFFDGPHRNTTSTQIPDIFFFDLTRKTSGIIEKDTQLHSIVTCFDHRDLTKVSDAEIETNNTTFFKDVAEIETFFRAAQTTPITTFSGAIMNKIASNHRLYIPLLQTATFLKCADKPLEEFLSPTPSNEFLEHIKYHWLIELTKRRSTIQQTLENDSREYMKANCSEGSKEIQKILDIIDTDYKAASTRITQAKCYDELKSIWPAVLSPKPKVF